MSISKHSPTSLRRCDLENHLFPPSFPPLPHCFLLRMLLMQCPYHISNTPQRLGAEIDRLWYSVLVEAKGSEINPSKFLNVQNSTF